MFGKWMRALVLSVLLLSSGCASNDGGSKGCTTDEQCEGGKKCGDDGQCVALCSCSPLDPCTLEAPECKARTDVTSEVASEVHECTACTFKSQCDDDNKCTKDDCVEGCCTHKVYTPEEALGCCTTLADCLNKGNELATTDNPDGDPCTVDRCTEDFHCISEMEDPTCCRKDSDCTDENFCTSDTCQDNICVFSAPIPACCTTDTDCVDDSPCTMDICVAGLCTHPQDNMNAPCGCASNTDCDDGNDCTTDSCLSGKCVYDLANGVDCCGHSSQCDDADDTTVDECKMFKCLHVKLKTCVSDGTCMDDDACTEDKCQDGHCIHIHTDDPYCCNFNSDCEDGNECTQGKCLSNMCQYQILDKEGCCKSNIDCDDGIGCTIDECVNWKCTGTPVGAKCCTPDTAEVVCDDGNPCTIDKCENGLCDWQIVSGGCCTINDDCMDCLNVVTGDSSGCQVDHTTTPPTCKGENCVDNVCTIHVCSNEFCYYTPLAGCCLADSDCTDSNPCTVDTCGASNQCTNELNQGCCANNGMCNDGDICTVDLCDIPAGTETGSCIYSDKPECCKTPDECPSKQCKTTFCQNGNCVYVDKDNCCVHDQECNDSDICTVDKCIESTCSHTPSGAPGCDR